MNFERIEATGFDILLCWFQIFIQKYLNLHMHVIYLNFQYACLYHSFLGINRVLL